MDKLDVAKLAAGAPAAGVAAQLRGLDLQLPRHCGQLSMPGKVMLDKKRQIVRKSTRSITNV